MIIKCCDNNIQIDDSEFLDTLAILLLMGYEEVQGFIFSKYLTLKKDEVLEEEIELPQYHYNLFVLAQRLMRSENLVKIKNVFPVRVRTF